MANSPKKNDNREDRIIALLNQLGERMIRGESSRRDIEESISRFDELFNTLEDRAANSEKVFMAMQTRITRAAEMEKTIRERQEKLEREQKAQAEKLERASSLAVKIEEALAQQARLARRRENMTQDRARMLHKLERIEEAVVETREALNGSTLLLTDQRAPAAPQLPADPKAGRREPAGKSWWDRPVYHKLAATAALFLFLAAGGWAASALYNKQAGTDAALSQPSAIASVEEDEAPVPTDVAEMATPVAMEDPATEAEQAAIDPTDEEDMSARFDEDPDALAAQLNQMEPGTADAAAETSGEVTTPEVEIASTPAAPAHTAAPVVMADAGDVDAFIAAQKDSRPLESRIQRDASLPPVVKEVEGKAFEGVAEAQHDLAAIYTAGHGGVKIDYPRAIAWFREAAVNGVANARYNLGVLYQQGMGVEKNIAQAISWYKTAAKLDHPEAQYNLGIAYIEGTGTPYNPGKAAMYFEQAANAGIVEAAYNLGLILENGLLSSPNPREALMWYKKAADAGSPEAKTAMDHLAKAMNISQADIQELYKTSKAAASSAPQAPQKAPAGKSSAVKKAAPVREARADIPSPQEQRQTIPLSDATPSTPAADMAVVAQIQEQLVRLGLYPGPADGIMGPQTEDAIRAYQKMNQLPHDGRPTQALLVNLLSADLAEPPSGESSFQ